MFKMVTIIGCDIVRYSNAAFVECHLHAQKYRDENSIGVVQSA